MNDESATRSIPVEVLKKLAKASIERVKEEREFLWEEEISNLIETTQASRKARNDGWPRRNGLLKMLPEFTREDAINELSTSDRIWTSRKTSIFKHQYANIMRMFEGMVALCDISETEKTVQVTAKEAWLLNHWGVRAANETK